MVIPGRPVFVFDFLPAEPCEIGNRRNKIEGKKYGNGNTRGALARWDDGMGSLTGMDGGVPIDRAAGSECCCSAVAPCAVRTADVSFSKWDEERRVGDAGSSALLDLSGAWLCDGYGRSELDDEILKVLYLGITVWDAGWVFVSRCF